MSVGTRSAALKRAYGALTSFSYSGDPRQAPRLAYVVGGSHGANTLYSGCPCRSTRPGRITPSVSTISTPDGGVSVIAPSIGPPKRTKPRGRTRSDASTHPASANSRTGGGTVVSAGCAGAGSASSTPAV